MLEVGNAKIIIICLPNVSSCYVCTLYSVNRYSPVCVQSVVQRKRATLNHVAFNPVDPILVAGDSRGAVHSLKLSPNLRPDTLE